ncbi:hypothetical protein SISNIDRAFT_413425, partial [Sistotremastrum niveocremeum HHB9708]
VHPFPNFSAFLYNHWHWTGTGRKSQQSRDSQQKEVFQHPFFVFDDIKNVNFKKIDNQLKDPKSKLEDGEGWKQSAVSIYVPDVPLSTVQSRREETQMVRDGNPPPDGPRGRRVFVEGLTHRPLTDVIKNVFSASEGAQTFHYEPFEEYWVNPLNPDGTEQRVYGELYSSESLLRADAELQASPREEGCDLPRAVAACMFWSDATHLAQFGQAKLWPCYVQFGNQSKYDRCKPQANASHHFAYLPSIQTEMNRAGAIDALLTHCRRELFQASWEVLLDDEFIEAYQHGIVIKCADGITRRIYPRIITYSADYPEKTQIASIRDMGGCPCPRCLIRLSEVPQMGTQLDKRKRLTMARVDSERRVGHVTSARDLIYIHGLGVNSERVNALLKDESLVPTENAFSKKLRQFGFNLFLMLVIDFMHEFELGVWKALLTHLIRMLYATHASTVIKFNERFRAIPSFGKSTIRKFSANVAEMKKLAARDFEDILQCAIPCFEDLFPEDSNESILKLLYLMAEWHSLAKLRMHTTSSLQQLDLTTSQLGSAMRSFVKNICPRFQTFETPSEQAKRARMRAAKVSQSAGTSAPAASVRRPKTMNLETYKWHALGDYVATVPEVGTMDSISSQNGELEHRNAKSRYFRTSKNGFVLQIALITALLNRLQQIKNSLKNAHVPLKDEHEYRQKKGTHGCTWVGTCLLHCLQVQVHHLAKSSQVQVLEISKFHLSRYLMDIPDFVIRLKEHLWLRSRGLEFDDETPVTPEQRNSIIIKNDRIYSHKTMQINYTTYDVRRDQDIINLKTKSFVMMLAHEDEANHPYWYAQVLGIYHAHIFQGTEREPIARQFLHVRWLGPERGWRGGTAYQRLDRVSYVDANDDQAFGFLDPVHIIRGAHLIPAFALGRTHSLLGHSRFKDPDGDWLSFYVNRFVDRDMRMRYGECSVGHSPNPFPIQPSDRFEAIKRNAETLSLSLDDISGESGIHISVISLNVSRF